MIWESIIVAFAILWAGGRIARAIDRTNKTLIAAQMPDKIVEAVQEAVRKVLDRTTGVETES